MVLSIEYRQDLAIIHINNPPVNALSVKLRAGLLLAIEEINEHDEIKIVILICAGRTFIAGADISEFGKPPLEPHLPDVILALEASPKIYMAAIHGTSLGGGLEIALGCDYRIMDIKAKLGLPEVTLGLIPGAGGTVRLPRIIGAEAAINMITRGQIINAKQALDVNLVHKIIDSSSGSDLANDLLNAAISYAGKVKNIAKPTALCHITPDNSKINKSFWIDKQKSVGKAAKGQESPMRALESIKNSMEMDFDQALKSERKIFINCRKSVQSSALRHMFFAEKSAVKPKWLDKTKPTRVIKEIGVIGGGTMGAGICAALQLSGFKVILIEQNQQSLQNGVDNLAKIYAGSVKRGKLTTAQMTKNIADLGKYSSYDGLANVDLVIEAVFEDLDVKRQVFKKLNQICKPDAILATNTSYLDPNLFGDELSNPDNFIGIHFFSPAHIMKLVEVISTDKTSDDTIVTVFDLVKKMRKIPVSSKICDGFIGNRILKIYRRQAEILLLNGCFPSDIDSALRQFGMAMGPFEAQDLGGLDIAFSQRQNAAKNGDIIYAPIADELCKLKRFGQKTGGGWYDYEKGKRQPVPSDIVAEIIEQQREVAAITAKEFEISEIQNHIIYPMINEALLILDEAIAKYPVDIDLVEVLGFGFPRWRGGLLHYADQVGLGKINDFLKNHRL